MKIVIVEDEDFAARRLENMISEYDSSIEILTKLQSVSESVAWLKNNQHPDLIFLDIQLDDDLSFSIFNQVLVQSHIIFTTAFDEYAIRAFKFKSIDYLLKPIIREELYNAIKKYKDMVAPMNQAIDFSSLFDLISRKSITYKERFSVIVGQKIKTFPVSEIAYFYSTEGFSFMVLKNKSEYALDDSLEILTQQLNPKEYFRINRKYLVKIESIIKVHIFPKSRLKLELMPLPKEDIFVSIDKVTSFKNWLDNK
ncbi:MAG TPA: LytTR family DNA-binding domain-containing protein [Prolixibacteraceae bacterium]|nr:LytTR family DNA-binding domain-containing protein [Prolixibacteraceae bacterium]